MSLSRYGAWFFAARQMGTFADGVVPADADLPAGADCAALATALADAVGNASLVSDQGPVGVDRAALGLAATRWRRVFDVRDALLACACPWPGGRRGGRSLKVAFGDYIVTRWVFKLVYGFEIERRPEDREFPPSFDGDAKAGLADSLADTAQAVGLAVKDRHALVQGAPRWQMLGGARAALMRQVQP